MINKNYSYLILEYFMVRINNREFLSIESGVQNNEQVAFIYDVFFFCSMAVFYFC
jgi:hypothetical protein